MRTLTIVLAFGLAACTVTHPADDALPDGGPPVIDAPLGARIDCPMPLRSRNRATVTSRGYAAGLVDGDFLGPSWGGGAGDWVAIDVGVGPDQVMAAWSSAVPAGAPRGYAIETSADSTTGRDGTWTVAVTVADNLERTRAHAVRFAGQRWLRLRLVTGDAELLALAVHDASAGTCDSWLFLGDSITAMAFNLSTGFSDDVHAARRATYPLRMAIGEGGTNTQTGLERLDDWLAAYPDVTNWVVSYGTNDMGGGDPAFAPAYGDRMIELVSRLRDAGKRVFVPHIPYGTWDPDGRVIPVYNAQVDRVVREAEILAGPDLYEYFRDHPDQLADDVHPDPIGGRAMDRLWSETALRAYP